MSDYFKNPWNYIHFLGSCVLTIALLLITQWSPFIVFGLGFLWECADECKKRFGWNVWFLDPMGFDWRDLFIMDAAGIILGLIL